MILISSSLGKSGSTLICSYQEDLLLAAHQRSGQSKLYEAFDGRFVETFSLFEILKLLYINFRYGSIVVKTHSKPNLFLFFMINLGIARATFSYRDIRDMILSAIDHGRREGGESKNPFAEWTDVESSILHAQYALRCWREWKDFGNVFFIRYESLMQDKKQILKNMLDYLDWTVAEHDVDAIIDKHEHERFTAVNFNKGTIQRYKTEMSDIQIALCNNMFADYLVEEGYEL